MSGNYADKEWNVDKMKPTSGAIQYGLPLNDNGQDWPVIYIPRVNTTK